jgi:hypothetical protein
MTNAFEPMWHGERGEMNLPDIVSYPDTGSTLAVTAPTARLGFSRGGDRS